MVLWLLPRSVFQPMLEKPEGVQGGQQRVIGKQDQRAVPADAVHLEIRKRPEKRRGEKFYGVGRDVDQNVQTPGGQGKKGLFSDHPDQGEDQQKLDRYADEVFIDALKSSGQCAGVASEENQHEVVFTGEFASRGKYVVCMDPLDGSSNIDVNVSVGTIFSILRCPGGRYQPTKQAFLFSCP